MFRTRIPMYRKCWAIPGQVSNMASRPVADSASLRCSFAECAASPGSTKHQNQVVKICIALMQYCDAIRLGNLELFKAIEKESTSWWSTQLDRGAGTVLHIAAEHGQVCGRTSPAH